MTYAGTFPYLEDIDNGLEPTWARENAMAEPADKFTLDSLAGQQWLTEQTEPAEDTFDDEDLPSFEISGWDV